MSAPFTPPSTSLAPVAAAPMDEERFSIIAVPRPLIAWIVYLRWHNQVPRSITDVGVAEYQVVGARINQWGGGGFLVQSGPDVVEPIEQLVEIENGDGVLLEVLPVDEKPDMGKRIPQAIDILARRMQAKLARGGAA